MSHRKFHKILDFASRTLKKAYKFVIYIKVYER